MKAGLDEAGARDLWAKIISDVVLIEDVGLRDRVRIAMNEAEKIASLDVAATFSTEWFCAALLSFQTEDKDVRDWFHDTLICRMQMEMSDEN